MNDEGWQNVLRFEQANLANRPSTETIVDGHWIVRLTKDHPSRRLNSLTVLSPADHQNFQQRLDRVFDAFSQHDQSPCVRWTPLMPFAMDAHLSKLGWSREAETLVMAADLQDLRASFLDRPPVFGGSVSDCTLSDWIEVYCDLGGIEAKAAERLRTSFQQSTSELCCLLATSGDGNPMAVAMAAIENNLIGFFELFTKPGTRRQGCATALIREALLYADRQGVKTSWLQVMSSTRNALRLYEKIGYDTVYSYHYRKPPNIQDN